MAVFVFRNYFLLFYHFLLLYCIGVISVLKQIIEKHKKIKELPKQRNKVAIVTGGSRGIGFQVAKILASCEFHVIIATKNVEDGKKAVENIKKEYSTAEVEFQPLDLNSLLSISRFVEHFLKRNLALHLLINNAGIMCPPYQLTQDGFESQFGVNYLGHFFLTQLLLEKLAETGTKDVCSRIINVSSSTHYVGRIQLNDLNSRQFYSPHAGYAQSKLALVLFTYELQRQLVEAGAYVTTNTLHPGVVYSDLYENVHWFVRRIFSCLRKWLFIEPIDGADTIIYVALSPEIEGIGGKYFENCVPVESSFLSQDKNLQLQLWRESEKLLQIYSNKKILQKF